MLGGKGVGGGEASGGGKLGLPAMYICYIYMYICTYVYIYTNELYVEYPYLDEQPIIK